MELIKDVRCLYKVVHQKENNCYCRRVVVNEKSRHILSLGRSAGGVGVVVKESWHRKIAPYQSMRIMRETRGKASSTSVLLSQGLVHRAGSLLRDRRLEQERTTIVD
jgi:hypothetical protein